MPTSEYLGSPWSRDPRRWERVRREIAAEMVASGWNPRAGKFEEVLRRKAIKRFCNGKA